MKVAIIGSRDFSNLPEMFKYLDMKKDKITEVVSGGAKGADSCAQQWAKERGKKCVTFYANWHPEGKGGTYDKGAGFKRNRLIVEEADKVYAFWDGSSKGTQNSMELAVNMGKQLIVFYYDSIDQTVTNYKVFS
jgi:hypothetical protein